MLHQSATRFDYTMHRSALAMGETLRARTKSSDTLSGPPTTADDFGGANEIKRIAIALGETYATKPFDALIVDACDGDGMDWLEPGDAFIASPHDNYGARAPFPRGVGGKPNVPFRTLRARYPLRSREARISDDREIGSHPRACLVTGDHARRSPSTTSFGGSCRVRHPEIARHSIASRAITCGCIAPSSPRASFSPRSSDVLPRPKAYAAQPNRARR